MYCITRCSMLDRCTFAAGLIAAPVTRRFGRRLTMVVGECMQLCWDAEIESISRCTSDLMRCYCMPQEGWLSSLEVGFWLELCTSACSFWAAYSWGLESGLPIRPVPAFSCHFELACIASCSQHAC